MSAVGTRQVLAVDDSLFMHRVIAAALRGSEFAVTFASGCEEALQRYAAARPDVVLLDVVMPGTNGRDTLDRLLAADAGARIVMLSSLGTEEAVTGCIEAGACEFVQKPFDPAQLLAALRRAIPGAS